MFIEVLSQFLPTFVFTGSSTTNLRNLEIVIFTLLLSQRKLIPSKFNETTVLHKRYWSPTLLIIPILNGMAIYCLTSYTKQVLRKFNIFFFERANQIKKKCYCLKLISSSSILTSEACSSERVLAALVNIPNTCTFLANDHNCNLKPLWFLEIFLKLKNKFKINLLNHNKKRQENKVGSE